MNTVYNTTVDKFLRQPKLGICIFQDNFNVHANIALSLQHFFVKGLHVSENTLPNISI